MLRPVYAVMEREVLRLLRQRARLAAALARPLVWLLVIGAGFGALYDPAGRAAYQQFLVPGVVGMTLLFGAMLAALGTVHDKEFGVMRMLVMAPLPHAWIVIAKLLAAALVAALQALVLLAALAALGYLAAGAAPLLLAAALAATAFACAAIGMLVAAFSRTLENFAAVMNFVIFPVFFLSGSLYPVQALPAGLRAAAMLNPYTYGVDLLRHALPAGAAGLGTDFGIGRDLAVLALFTVCATALACWRFSREAAHEPLVRRLARKGA
ncbi:MAG TPA: ABC transporter permease [Burkholderiales bacterium]